MIASAMLLQIAPLEGAVRRVADAGILSEVQQFPITFKLSGPAPNLGVRHGSVVAGARWGHSNTIQAAAWLVKLR